MTTSFLMDPLVEGGQDWFAGQVRDFNPIHLSQQAARRSVFGQKIVHGMHACIRILDKICERKLAPFLTPDAHIQIKVNYRQPTYPQDRVRVEVDTKRENIVKFRAFVDELTVITGQIKHLGTQVGGDNQSQPHFDRTFSLAELREPVANDFADIQAIKHACINLPQPLKPGLEEWYPHISKQLGAERLFSFATLSSVVGMIIPGKYSLFISLDCEFFARKASAHAQCFTLTNERLHEDFKFVKSTVKNNLLRASLETLNRPPPVEQPKTASILSQIQHKTYTLPDLKGKTALVIGGSRGLGASCARVLSICGAHVTLSYAHNKDAALLVKADLQGPGAVMHLDINKSQSEPFEAQFDHIYYFATPAIFVRKTLKYDRRLLDKFINYFVDGFLGCTNRFAHPESSIFYPSTVEIESDNMATIEYRISKQAGETLCESLAQTHKRQNYVLERLPRLASDQTATLQPAENEDTLAVLSGVLCKMARSDA